MSECVEPIVGKILAGWRYDISGLAPEMRGDYELHFADCEHCRSRQKLHRIIDISLMVLASASALAFLLAFALIRYFGPRHAFWLEVGALAGFALSALIWLIVAVATPAPMAVVDERTMELTVKKDGKVTTTGRITVSADGKSRTVSTSGTDSKGKKVKSTAVYDKQ